MPDGFAQFNGIVGNAPTPHIKRYAFWFTAAGTVNVEYLNGDGATIGAEVWNVANSGAFSIASLASAAFLDNCVAVVLRIATGVAFNVNTGANPVTGALIVAPTANSPIQIATGTVYTLGWN